VGDRVFAQVGPLELEFGGQLDRVTVAYETWGTLAPDGSNAVLVLHALTGDSHVVGESNDAHPTPGWWDGLIGPHGPLDSDRWFVVAPNVLGGCQGTTGPSSLAGDGSPYGSRFPRITVRDQVRAEQALADHLGIDRWAAVIGGSMGGMRALEWAVSAPERVGSALVLAVGAVATADQIATQTIQNIAVMSDPHWNSGDYYDAPDGQGPTVGLGLARRIAHLTYRSEFELQERFSNDAQVDEDPLHGGRYAVQSYLDHHANKLARRFDAGSYVALTDAMNTWDVGRGRGGVERVLRSLQVPLLVAGIDTDRLYPIHLQEQIAELAGNTVTGLRIIKSDFGHDGFLIEHDEVFALVEEILDLAQTHLTAG